jgi:hypothetical protein
MINYFDEEDMMRLAVIQATDEQSSAAASSYSGGGGGGGVGEDGGYMSILLPEMRVSAWCPQFEDSGAGENNDNGDAACNSVGAGNSADADEDGDDDAVSLAPPHCAQEGDRDEDEEKKKKKQKKKKKARDQLTVRLGKLWDDLRSVGPHIAGERGAAAGVEGSEAVVGEGSADSAAQTTLLVAGLQAVGAACEEKASFLMSDRKATSAKKNTVTGEATASILPPVESAVRVLVGRAAVDALVDAEIRLLGFYGHCLRAMAARVEEDGGGAGLAAGRWELCCPGSVLFGAVDDGG